MSTEADIVERLNGIVRVPVNDGAGLLDGKDFFERQFPTSKLAREAAAEITKLRAERDAAARDMRERCAQIADLHNSICARNAKRSGISEHDEELWDSAAGEAHDIAVAIRATALLATEGDNG